MAAPKMVTMVELRKNAEKIVEAVSRGQRMVLTYRGRPAVRLEPVTAGNVAADDPFYSISDLADLRGTSLTNEEIDETIYGR